MSEKWLEEFAELANEDPVLAVNRAAFMLHMLAGSDSLLAHIAAIERIDGLYKDMIVEGQTH
ncbi:hypothetical protein [Lacticaseibacillus saniviri]|uniref:hypothetical protein n=1 Tax=Lacticaseibacillus saniviri TaxID=931533 RepID=UPI000704CF0B|nr:hypothetical protein [Lacticaseibacillus saniviri]